MSGRGRAVTDSFTQAIHVHTILVNDNSPCSLQATTLASSWSICFSCCELSESFSRTCKLRLAASLSGTLHPMANIMSPSGVGVGGACGGNNALAVSFDFGNINNNAHDSGNSNNNSNNNNNPPMLLTCTPADITVDYDTNITPLYEYIGDSDWSRATDRCRQVPSEACTWVIRYRRDPATGAILPPSSSSSQQHSDNVLWRFLPIHSACALNPPTSFIRALLQCHPHGTRTLDDQGMLPLHYACGARCSREVLYLLLMSFPQAALRPDPNGMLPLHYLAQWGPSEAGAVDMVCVATGHKVCGSTDNDGNTPEMLARNANYAGWEDVAKQIRSFGSKFQRQYKAGDNVPRTPTQNNNNTVVGLDLNFGGSSSTIGGGGGGSHSSSKKRRDLFVQTNNSGVRNIQHPNHHQRIKSDNNNMNYGSHINNENNLNLWNSSSPSRSTDNENRHVMDKLGISPSHKYSHSVGVGGGGVNVQKIQTTVQAYNWKDFSSRYYSPSRNNAPSNTTTTTNVAPTATTTVITDPRRSISTPRNFGSSGMNSGSNYNTIRSSIPTLTNDNVTPTIPYTSIYHPQKSCQNNNHSSSSSSVSSYTSGLPPKSPRYSDKSPRYSSLSTTPKNSGGGGVDLGGRGISYQYPENSAVVHLQQQQQQQQLDNRDSSRGGQLDNHESSIPTRQRSSSVGVVLERGEIRSPVSTLQDKRLSELREQLSSMYPVGGGGGGGNNTSSNNNAMMAPRSPSVPSVRFLEDEPREEKLPPSIRMQDSSQSTTSYGTQLTQQLQVFNEAEQLQRKEQPRYEQFTPKTAKIVELEEMRLREDLAKAKERDEAIRSVQREKEQLEMERDEAIRTIRNEKDQRETTLKEQLEKERDEAIRVIQAEKEQREIVLLEEIHRLRAEKEHAESALSDIATPMGRSLAVIYSGSEDGSNDEAYHDDDVSKLTFLDGSDHKGVFVSVPKEKKKSDLFVIGENNSGGSDHKDVTNLLKEKAGIEQAIQQALLKSTSNESTEMVYGDRKVLTKKITELSEQVLREQQKYAELEKQHSEAVYSHLQEVTTLRVSFDKAKVDVDNYRKSAEAELEVKEKEWNEERRKLEERIKLETQAKIIVNETLLNKEREWNDERSTLESQIEEYKGKCKTAQREIEEYREDAKSLREGFDKARIEIDKYRDVADRGLKIKEMEWSAKQLSLEEQIIQLSRFPQVEGQTKPEVMENNEVPWAEEREHLETEIRSLKETIATALGTNSSTASIQSTVKTDCTYNGEVTNSSAGNDTTAKEHLRIQLTNAVKEAEDMRNFNALIRKEHAMTIDSLESELKEERKSKTECMNQIVKLQYEVSVLEQDLADNKAEVNRKMMQPTPRHRGHDSASYNSSSNDSQTYSQSNRSSEDSQKHELEVYKLKEALTEKIDEAKKYRRELETLKEEMDEADKRKLRWASSSAEYEEQILDLKKKIHHMQQQQMEDASINKPLVWDAAVQVGQNDSNTSRERILLERLDECNDRMNELQKDYKQDLIEREDAFRAELRETKKKFGDSIREQEKMYLRKLRDSKKDDEINDRDEVFRELQKEHERELVVKEDAFRAKLREQEDAFRVKLREQEERYVKEINDIKKKDDPYSSREIDKLMKQKDENNEKLIKKAIAVKEEEFNLRITDILASKAREYEHTISDLEDSVRVLKQIIGTKDKEFDAKVKELEDEIEQVKEELKDVTKDKLRVIEQHEIKVELLEDEIQELKQQETKASSKKDDRKSELSECKKELDRQRRKHRSEINQLKNTLEMQKSKQERLQSHIQSLEKQISDMVNDYESRLLNAMYGDVDGV